MATINDDCKICGKGFFMHERKDGICFACKKKLKCDQVNSPDHYTTGGIEPIEYIQAKLSPDEFKGFCVGNIIKYVSRSDHKGGVEDLKKAQWYLNKLIDVLPKS